MIARAMSLEVGRLWLGDGLPDPHTGAAPTAAQRHRAIVESSVQAEAPETDEPPLESVPTTPGEAEIAALRALGADVLARAPARAEGDVR